MRIAFDLDNTLIRCDYDFLLSEQRHSFLAKLLGNEGLRHGTEDIFEYCRRLNLEVWIYTTSYRSQWQIRQLFWLHGIKLNGVVNQQRHNQAVKIRCTKHPPTFGIHLLIDDSEGVRIESERHGFQVLVINPQDDEWTQKIKSRVTMLGQ